MRAGSTAAAPTAADGASATTDMVAERGRASYTGERSRGSVDAGAPAVAVIVEQISQAWADGPDSTDKEDDA